MIKKIIPFGLMFCFLASHGQNISVTFTGTGASILIDSITATNLRTEETITLPGEATLVLTPQTGIPSVYSDIGCSLVFPNPFPGQATLLAGLSQPQNVSLTVTDLAGRIIASTRAFLQPGENIFALSTSSPGIYLAIIETAHGKTAYKLISTGSSPSGNRTEHQGLTSTPIKTGHTHSPQQKTPRSTYNLCYSFGETLLYKCFSGNLTASLTDAPMESINYEVEFADCTDPDGKIYGTIHIGEQTWMAENLAWLPAVSDSKSGSDTEKHYYVYGYDSTNVNSAKKTEAYCTYGVLYNWLAATDGAPGSTSVPSRVKGICPDGWHLPSMPEWQILFNYLVDCELNVCPGGFRCADGGFGGFGIYAFFWSSTELDAHMAWGPGLYYSKPGLGWSEIDKRTGLFVRCLRD